MDGWIKIINYPFVPARVMLRLKCMMGSFQFECDGMLIINLEGYFDIKYKIGDKLQNMPFNSNIIAYKVLRDKNGRRIREDCRYI